MMDQILFNSFLNNDMVATWHLDSSGVVTSGVWYAEASPNPEGERNHQANF
jgi:hypothetical protein